MDIFLIRISFGKNGYFFNYLLGKKEYKQKDNEICIGKRYIIRNQGDVIEVWSRGLFNSEYLEYRIVKSDNRIYVYDRYYRGLEIVKTQNEINAISNNRNSVRYSVD